MDPLSSALAVLTAMITPAVLVTACGTLILSTSSRLGRVVNRVRDLSDRFEELAHASEDIDLLEERRTLIFDQLAKLMRRARTLQRTLSVLYLAVGTFVSTSVALGIVGISNSRYTWIPVALGLLGAFFLFYGSVLLIIEARLGLGTLRMELDFIAELRVLNAPEGVLEERSRRGRHSRRIAKPEDPLA